jgi:Tfp pilus assembly protein PilE
MRKTLSFGIVAILTVVAITAWATATTRSQNQPEPAAVAINAFAMMTNATDLPVQRYDAF